MKKLAITTFFLSSIILSGCGGGFHVAYQPNVQQGNIITEQMLSQLKLGMSKEEVEAIIGMPVLVNNFNSNHWAYAYTFQKNGSKISKKNLDLFFQDGRLVKIKN